MAVATRTSPTTTVDAARRALRVGLVLVPAFGERGSFTPLGLAYLNGALRGAGYEPSYHDLNARVRSEDPTLQGELVAHGFSPDDGGFFGPELDLLLQIGRRESFGEASFADRIRARVALDADRLPALHMALLTLWDSNLYYAAALGRELRSRGCKVVMGGPSAGLDIVRELMVRLGAADAVMQGEGEVRAVALAERVLRGEPLEGLTGVTTLGERGRAVDGAAAANLRIHDVPRPSFEGMPTDHYLPVITSRGCIRDCSFCTEKFNWRRYRQRKVDDVLDEMQAIIDRYGVDSFEFNDDLINGHVRWLDQFLDGMLERDWGLQWTCFMEPYRLSPQLIGKIAKAGCTLVKYGVQHFDREMLRQIGRGDEVGEVVDTLRLTADHGIRVSFDIIPGHPNETEAQHAVNMRMLPEVLQGHDLLEANINPFLLLYGSPVHLAPGHYGVDIEYWDETLFPKALRAEFGDLAPRFIRSYRQEPTRDVVIARTRQLEDVGRRNRGRHGLATVPASSGRDPGLLGRLRRRGVARLGLRPEAGTTPRELLQGLEQARAYGFHVAALQTSGAPLDHPRFTKLARDAGMNHALLEPGGSPEERSGAATALRQAGVPWAWHVEPQTAEQATTEALVAEVDEARRLGAATVLLGFAPLMDRPDGEAPTLDRAAGAANAAMARGQQLGLPVVVHGLPFCHLTDREDALAPTPPVDALDAWGQAAQFVRLVQPPTCRGCQLSNHCPGLPEKLLARVGADALRPQVGRPEENRAPTAFEAMLSVGAPQVLPSSRR